MAPSFTNKRLVWFGGVGQLRLAILAGGGVGGEQRVAGGTSQARLSNEYGDRLLSSTYLARPLLFVRQYKSRQFLHFNSLLHLCSFPFLCFLQPYLLSVKYINVFIKLHNQIQLNTLLNVFPE